MSYDSLMDGKLAMAIAMSTGNASEGLETVQNAEQNRARSACRLPKDMRPSKEAFESLKFTFKDIGDDVLYQATLPDGWTLKSDGGYWTYLIDEKGRERGNYFYKGAFWDRSGHMNLHTRFRVCHEYISDDCDSPIKICAKDADGTVIFDAGQCKEYYADGYEDKMKKATEYLDTNYPDWNDPTKYWD